MANVAPIARQNRSAGPGRAMFGDQIGVEIERVRDVLHTAIKTGKAPTGMSE